MITLYNGDCLVENESIEDESVDLILIDPPYGTIRGMDLRSWDSNTADWDIAIGPDELFRIANRILRKRGRMIIFSQQPYTTRLINNSNPHIAHAYNMIWVKNDFANYLTSNVAPVSYYEDILMFRKITPLYDYEGNHPLRSYFADVMNYIGLSLGGINAELGHRRAEHSFYIKSVQFSIPTEDTYNQLIETFDINRMAGYLTFNELSEIDKAFKEENSGQTSTFNLWDGKGHKSNIFKYNLETDRYHPTQKPVLLLEDLIKTFSNEGDLIVDLTMGSGSTGVACKNTGRRFIGIEMDEGYYNIAKERLNKITLGDYQT